MKKKKRKSNNFYGVLFLVLLIAILSFFYFLYTYNIVSVEEIYVSSNLTTIVGFDLNKTALTFGNVVKENSASRNIIISNNYEEDIIVNLKVYGAIKEHLYVKENRFLVEVNEKKEIEVILFFDESVSYGFYDGKIKIISRRI